jgi:TatD DNase family protein
MRIFDSHCHLDDPSYTKDIAQVIDQARSQEVLAAVTVSVNLESSRKAGAIASRFPGIYASVGIHPHDAKLCLETDLEEMAEMARSPKVIAWGEMGLDHNRMHSPRPDQEACFIRQIEMAKRVGLPMIFHERDTHGRFLELLKQHISPGQTGVVHCFSGTREELDAYLSLGLYVGITGVVTIKSRGEALRNLVPHIPEDRLLVETDAPYLVPTPQRNKHRRNEPAFVKSVLLKLAEIRNVPPEVLGAAVWENTCRFFRLPADFIS